MDCKCRVTVRYKTDIQPILDKIEYCPKHAAVDDLIAALENIEYWQAAVVCEVDEDSAGWHAFSKESLLAARAALAKAKEA